MINIVQAEAEPALNDARSLVRAFVAWIREAQPEDRVLLDRYFVDHEMEEELAGLPGRYALPRGRLLLGYKADQPAGCVGLRDLGDDICEMKRMFVPSQFRGQGVGRALVVRLLQEARLAGYRLMRLDTSFQQHPAIQLYESAGFYRIAPYYDVPDDLRTYLVFYERDLRSHDDPVPFDAASSMSKDGPGL